MNAGVAIVYEYTGFKELADNIGVLKAYMANSIIPYQRAAALVTGSVQRNFVEGGRPKKWKELSLLSYFVRSHRYGKQNKTPLTLVDTGRLRDSIVPHFATTSEGGEFGAKTNVSYARLQNDGGVSTPSQAVIKSFTRKAPKSSGRVRVRGYVMNIKGGHHIPARPFMLLQAEDRTRIRSVFSEWMRGIANGEYR